MNKQVQAIRAEIIRLYDVEAPKHGQQCDFDDGYFTGIAAISKFIDSLPEEKPAEDLEEAAREYAYSWHKKGDKEECELFPVTASRGFIAGAKWQAEHTEDYPMPEDTVLFQKGVAEGRRLASEETEGINRLTWRDIRLILFLNDALEAEESMPRMPVRSMEEYCQTLLERFEEAKN